MALSQAEVEWNNADLKETPAQKAYFVGTLGSCTRPGIPAEILGVKIVAIYGGLPQPCFHIRYPNGIEEYAAMQCDGHDGDSGCAPSKVGLGEVYQIISEKDNQSDATSPSSE